MSDIELFPEIADSLEWNKVLKPLFDVREGGEEAAAQWLDIIVRQQAEEALTVDSVSAAKIKGKEGDAFKITIKDAKKRVIQSVDRNVIAELPAFQKYVEENFDDDEKLIINSFGNLTMGRISGMQNLSDFPVSDDYASKEEYHQALIDWYDKTTSTWDLDELKLKWYEVKDADGTRHVAACEAEDDGGMSVPATIGVGYDNPIVILYFKDNKLTELYFPDDSTGWRKIRPADLKNELEVMPIQYVSVLGALFYHIPISESSFTVSAENADKIQLEYRNIKKIKEIADTDGDGKAFSSTADVTDIYGQSIDITDLLENPEEELINIEFARIKPQLYTGEVLTPEVVYQGTVLEEGKDYELIKVYNEDKDPEPEFKEPGEYEVTLFGKGSFDGYAYFSFNIVMPEDETEQALADAEAAVSEAQAKADAVLANNDADAQEIKTAYDSLVKAYQALTDAQETLNRTKQILSDEEKAQLEDAITKLEQQIEQLNANETGPIENMSEDTNNNTD